MKFSRLWAHDGNNSLKRMLPVGGRIAADTRLFTDSDYFLPRSFVDRYANEVTSRRTHRHREITTGDSDDESDTDASPDSTEGDATDGMQEGERREIDQCVKHLLDEVVGVGCILLYLVRSMRGWRGGVGGQNWG